MGDGSNWDMCERFILKFQDQLKTMEGYMIETLEGPFLLINESTISVHVGWYATARNEARLTVVEEDALFYPDWWEDDKINILAEWLGCNNAEAEKLLKEADLL